MASLAPWVPAWAQSKGWVNVWNWKSPKLTPSPSRWGTEAQRGSGAHSVLHSLWQCGGTSTPAFTVPSGLWVKPGVWAGLQGRPGRPLTILPVEANLSPVLLMALQGLVEPLQGWLAGLGTVEEAAAAGFLHDLGAAVTGELAKAVRAVDDGKAPGALRVGQKEVTVCGKKRSRSGPGQEGSSDSSWAEPPSSCCQGSQGQKLPRLPWDSWILLWDILK